MKLEINPYKFIQNQRNRIKRKPRKNDYKTSHRGIAIFFICIFLNTLVPYNHLWANNNGPNAPEAAAFEPVDATDMVNLLTGDFSYVLPLLNVPSPEGGYPLALSYHAGIAMDQEASWVGLGWSLNPGAINRSVNGYPDDWGKTYVGEFFYDKEWEENYYNFSIGGTLPNGITLGVGGSWGSNQAFGGIVSIGYAGFTADFGVASNSNYYGLGYRAGGFNYGFSTQGVNIGYGQSFTGIGLNANYNSNNGLSGTVSAGTQIGYKGIHSTGSVGISFSSNGVSLSGNASFSGIGASNSKSNVSTGDYDVSSKTRGLNLDFGAFWIGYRHKKIKYSLFKASNLFVTGTLYPYATKRTQRVLKNGGVYNTFFQEFDYTMDTYNTSLGPVYNTFSNYNLPSYDNYSVNAQGLAATMQPRTFNEIVLYGNGNYEKEGTASLSPLKSYEKFVLNTTNDNFDIYNIGNRTNFYFTNSNNSFLRIKREFKEITDSSLYNQESGLHALISSTKNSIDFSQNVTPNGDKIRAGNNNYRKRGGAYIETFTNKEIRDNQIQNFIEAKNIELDRRNKEIFIDESIGAYKITTIDGKTYHYSLPVYQFEVFYKNFKGNDETQNFYEQKKMKPYATHWLLTAVTGPDYIDNNNNGKVDKNDYGYWVEFEYGKWSEGFAWRGPKGTDYNSIKERVWPWNNSDDITNNYTWGRKQIYYLDQIKTRTHTALFIKDLRSDNLSSFIDIKNSHYNGSNNFDIKQYGNNIKSSKRKIFSLPGEILYNADNEPMEIPYNQGQGNVVHYEAFIENQKYVYLPKTKSLKLSKILLLKNESLPTNISQLKSLGNLTSSIEGKMYINDEYTDVRAVIQHHNINQYLYLSNNYSRREKKLMNIFSQLHENVIDVSDIRSLELENRAVKVIDFNLEYKLSGNVPNSESQGKRLLTLSSVNTKGKNGAYIIPPYRFEYNKASYSFDRNNRDNWGYFKNNPDALSLNRILTPTGGEINISYESDSYEIAALGPSSGENPFTLTKHSLGPYADNIIERIEKSKFGNEYIKVFYKTNASLQQDLSFYFTPGEIAHVDFNLSEINNISGARVLKSYSYDLYEVLQTQGKEWVLLKPTVETEHYNSLVTNTQQQGQYGSFLNSFSLTSIKSSYVVNDANGKKRGGVRVKNIAVDDNAGNQISTEYSYINPISKIISGVTSYEPEDTFDDGYEDDDENSPFISELPAPSVQYEFVTVSTKDKNSNLIGYSRYHFDVIKPITNLSKISGESGRGSNYIKVIQESEPSPWIDYIHQDGDRRTFSYNRKSFTIEDRSSSIGRVKSIKNYNSKSQLISSTTNIYKDDLDQDGEIGVTQESFLTYNQTKNEFHAISAGSAIISKINYPSKLESTITTNEGFTNTTFYEKYDFLTGQLLETKSTNSKGKILLSKQIPAYKIPIYNNSNHSMGAKVDNPTNKNMLTQTAATLTQIKEGSEWKTLNANITTWNNEWTYKNFMGWHERPTDLKEKIWRKHKTFVWDGALDNKGRYQGYYSDFDYFNWENPDDQSNKDWVNTSTVNYYDHYSMPIETQDINGNAASTKMTLDETKVQSICNSRYVEQYYSSAEHPGFTGSGDFIDQGIEGASLKTTEKAHLGKYSLKLNPNDEGFKIVMANWHGYRSDRYKISVWVHNDNATNARIAFNNQVIPFNGEQVEAGDWILMNHYVQLNGAEQKIHITSASGTIYADDFRIHPAASSMTSYVYNEWDELECITGANGLSTKYEYDEAGRLIKTYTEVIDASSIIGGFKQNNAIDYNYLKY